MRSTHVQTTPRTRRRIDAIIKQMNRWPIERTWQVVTPKGERSLVPTRELRNWPACVMLSAAGLGKTFEQSHLAELDRADGLEVVDDRLAVLGQTPDGLKASLDSLAAVATSNTVLYLDALDEVMVPVRTAGLIIQRWVIDRLRSVRPRLRLSCRSAVWPTAVQNAIEEVYGVEECAFAVLQPLSEGDVRTIASSHGVDPDGFLRAVDNAGVRVLSEQPLTLMMLLRIHEDHGALPDRRGELFRQGMERLASERRERARDGTGVVVPTLDLLEGAERLACLCLLSGRDVVDMSELPSPSALAARDVESLPECGRPLDGALLEAIGRSGLCDGDGPDRFRFGHRQFAEYLAGRRLARLLPHQSRALLRAGTSSGVAGPLRETAAFAAMESADIADWLSDQDPEVVGLSDVADVSLRRHATLNLLGKFRRHELTDSQTWRDGITLAGFQYPGAECDLRPVLAERQPGCDDVIACAVKLIESWNLSCMSDDLASLMLDPSAPLQNRKAAGYALANLGKPDACQRLLPLIDAGSDDPDFELKGLALRCNWPDRLTVPDLLTALVARPRTSFHGAYDWFLHELDHQGFDARGYRLQGLQWARLFARHNHEHGWTTNLVRRIAIGALDEIDSPGIADAIAEMILDAAQAHAGSPLKAPTRYSLNPETKSEPPPILSTKPVGVRRRLIDALATRVTAQGEFWWVVRETQGILVLEDFPWLLERAVDASMPLHRREHYAELASMLPWIDSAPAVEVWLQARDVEPIASRLRCPLMITLDSEEADKARKGHAEMKRWNRPPRRKRLRPSPAERVEQVLALSETKDPRFFLNVCQELTLDETSTHYGFSRFLMATPGWGSASKPTRARIVEAAHRFLATPASDLELARTEPLNRILPGHMTAIWLAMANDPEWIDSLSTEWWRDWAWYILRELRPNTMNEPEEPKIELLRRLHEQVPGEVRESILRLSKSQGAENRNLLTSLFGAFEDIIDSALDDALCTELESCGIPDDRVTDVAQFVLSRSGDKALPACLTLLDSAQDASRENIGVRAAVALLHERTREAWSSVFDLLHRRPDIAKRVLADFAHGQSFRSRNSDRDQPAGLAALSSGQVGQMFALLLEAFPPESDPHHDGAHIVGPSDSARHIRDQLISWLGDQKDLDAVEALRSLERKYGAKYPWLRRPRARAERSHRLSVWEPVAAAAVAEILAGRHKRLLSSDRDTLDGIVAAISEYSRRLRHDSPSELDDLWNQPRGGVATPKDEERVSDKVCVAIRSYFRDFAVAANREVQVFRRKLASTLGGAPGSEVDVLCEVPAVGSASGEAIRVPVEIKLAHNPQARTGLPDQLVGRYMQEIGTGLGVYAVVWMGKGSAARQFRPLWESPEEAIAELERQADALMAASPEPMDIRCIVVDASLPMAAKRAQSVRKNRSSASSLGASRRTLGKVKSMCSTNDGKGRALSRSGIKPLPTRDPKNNGPAPKTKKKKKK